MYGTGARKIGVLGIPPIGCMPSQRTLKGGLQRQCADNYNQMAELFNTKLIAEISNLNRKYPEARIVYGDIYNLPLDLIYNPQKYGTHSSLYIYFLVEKQSRIKSKLTSISPLLCQDLVLGMWDAAGQA